MIVRLPDGTELRNVTGITQLPYFPNEIERWPGRWVQIERDHDRPFVTNLQSGSLKVR